MKYLSGSADDIVMNIISCSKTNGETEVIACADVIKKFVKLLLNKGYNLIRCNVSDDDNWYQLSIDEDDMEVGEFYSTSSSDTIFFQFDVDEKYIQMANADIVIFELKYGIE